MKGTVSDVVQAGLCVSCGACSAACGRGAISRPFKDGMFAPEVDASKCVSCGMCVKVCPGATTDLAKFCRGGIEHFGAKPLGVHAAFALDGELRHASASGGVVTALLGELLRRGIYRRAYVVDFEMFDGSRQAALKAVASEEELRKAAKSKYVPVSVQEVVEAVRDGSVGGSVVVCTPCQLLAIRKAMDAYKVPEDDVLFVGLFCDKVFNYSVYDEYGRRFGKFDAMHFKDKDAGGWPGSTMLFGGEGTRVVDKSFRMALKESCKVARCDVCFDKLNQDADISVGDCYVPGFETREGMSNVIVRTEKGRRAMEAAKGVLAVRDCSYGAVKESQQFAAREKNLRKALKETALFANVPGRPREGERKKGGTFRVLIDVEGFQNRGDQLMLEAAYRQVRARIPGAVVAVPKKAFLEDPEWCMRRRIVPLLKFEKRAGRRMRQRFNRFVCERVLHRTGFVLPDQIDLVLFAAGFNYGDQFAEWYTPQNIEDEVRYYASFTKPGRRFVLLPQALGPFKTAAAKEKMLRLYRHVDRVYAREEVSFAHFMELLPDAKNVRTVPDFTCLCEPLEPSVRLPEKSYVAVIPNARMVTHTPPEIAGAYPGFMAGIVKALLDRGESVVFLNHEGRDDEVLIHELNGRFGNRLPVLSGMTGLDCKAVIAASKLTVSSRFHGVVSGLIEGVPTLCTSWSHKYGELLKEHGREGNVLDVLDLEKSAAKVLDALANPGAYASAQGCIERVRSQVMDMWDEIFGDLPPAAAECSEPKYRPF